MPAKAAPRANAPDTAPDPRLRGDDEQGGVAYADSQRDTRVSAQSASAAALGVVPIFVEICAAGIA
jgi:hypothetical protein